MILKANHLEIEKILRYSILIYIVGIFCFERPTTVLYWKIIQCTYILATIVYILIKKELKIGKFTIWQLLFIISCLLSYFISVNQDDSSSIAIGLIKNFIAVYGFYLYCEDKKRISHIIKYLSLAGILLGITVLTVVDLNSLGVMRLGLDENMLTSGFQANELGSYFVIAFYCSLYNSKFNKSYVIISIMMIIFILLTGSKKAFLCAAVGFIIISAYKNQRIKIKNLLVCFLFMVLIYIVIKNIPEFYNIIGFRIEELLKVINGNGLKNTTDAVRMTMIEKGIEWFKMRPIMGFGIGSYSTLWGEFSGIPTYSHNNYIELLVSLGIIGTLIYYSIYIYLSYKILKIYALSKDDETILIISIIIFLIISDIGVVTYDYKIYQILIALCSAYVVIKGKEKINGSKS